MACSRHCDAVLAAVFFAASLLLAGCNFGSTDSNNNCNGEACDCTNVYYGMEAGMYILGVPIEHASLHVTIPHAEPDQQNSTGCCSALFDLHPVREQGTNMPDAHVKQQFCDACVKAPNEELSEAAKSCSSSMSKTFLSSTSHDMQLLQDVYSTADEDMDGSDAYSDCWVDSTKTLPLVGSTVVKGVKIGFNIRWTDFENSTDKACCSAIQPLVLSLYFGKASKSEFQDLCNKCKSAFNPGVGLAAFRSCNPSATERQYQRIDTVSSVTQENETVALV